jgi:PKHD-type hydroxylase
MLLVVDNVLNRQELEWMRERYARIRFGDGRATAGDLAAQVKQNLQLANDTREHAELTQLVHAALSRCQPFMSAVLPLNISPPLFNRYLAGMQFGTHVDNAIRIDSAQPLRADVSATLFVSSPEDYAGGELVIDDVYGQQRLRLTAGSLVIYPSSSLHHVEPITEGNRDVTVFWVQSMVRSDAQRHLLYQMDQAIQSLRARAPDSPEIQPLVGAYHNLLRMWAEL